MNGVPVWRRMIAPGNDAAMYVQRALTSAAYMRSLKLPNRISGGRAWTFSRIAALSVFSPALRDTAKWHGRPISSSRKRRRPRA